MGNNPGSSFLRIHRLVTSGTFRSQFIKSSLSIAVTTEEGGGVNKSIMNNMNEVASGERFEFGANWANFLAVLNEERVSSAVDSLKHMLEKSDLSGKTFLDVGSGSGLFSLAARRLGARVLSFDFDPKSVACTNELRRRYYPDDASWQIQEGSVLDEDYLKGLGQFDIVYSWGVLHHTGSMWKALENVETRVANGGTLFIALYNDQGGASGRWAIVKRIFNRLPTVLRGPFALLVYLPHDLALFGAHLLRGRPDMFFRNIISYKKKRGMSWWHDRIDWIGGFPFEVSKPEEIFNFYRQRKYKLQRITTVGGGLGCNQYVFQRDP